MGDQTRAEEVAAMFGNDEACWEKDGKGLLRILGEETRSSSLESDGTDIHRWEFPDGSAIVTPYEDMEDDGVTLYSLSRWYVEGDEPCSFRKKGSSHD